VGGLVGLAVKVSGLLTVGALVGTLVGVLAWSVLVVEGEGVGPGGPVGSNTAAAIATTAPVIPAL